MVVNLNKKNQKNYNKKHLVKKQTRKNRYGYKYKYKNYYGGATPVTSPLLPLSLSSHITPSSLNVNPLNVSRASSRASDHAVDMSVLPLGVQAYAYNRNSPFDKSVILAENLDRQGSLRNLRHSENFHELVNKLSRQTPKRGIKSPLKRKTPIIMAPEVAVPNIIQSQPPLPPLPPPTPPKVVLTSKGRLKTTYTPPLDIIEDNTVQMNKKSGTGTLPLIYLLPFTYSLPEILPLSFLPKHDDIAAIIGPKLFDMIGFINTNNDHYSFISPLLYSILQEINKADELGVILIWGRLRDELIENITISSFDAIKSRMLFDDETTKLFMEKVKHVFFTQKINLGPSPTMENIRYPPDMMIFKIPTPKRPYEPTSLQFLGYNRHPMFNRNFTRNDELQLFKLSEQNKDIKGRETIFISAHGAIGKELSHEMKILANRYLRVIELGKMHELVSPKYKKMYLIINHILLDPKNAVMFNNTSSGEKKRKEIFDIICKYLHINKLDACVVKDTLSLTDITHDRVFGGHFIDDDIIEDHDINILTMASLYSTGIFIPVDYNKKKSKHVIYKKPIFELYPGTTFFSKSTSINMVETILPIAIRENKIMNIFIYSCAPNYTDNDKVFLNPTPNFQKPGTVNPAIQLLTEGKRFLYNTNRMLAMFVYIFYYDKIANLKPETVGKKTRFIQEHDYFPIGKPPDLVNINLIRNNMYDFFKKSFMVFLNEIMGFDFMAAFSFASLGSVYASNELIETDNPAGNNPYANELIKVKIYLMEEFYTMLSKNLDYFITVTLNILSVLSYLNSLYSSSSESDKNMRLLLSTEIFQAKQLNTFFENMGGVLMYIKNGFYGDDYSIPTLSPFFLYYPKYIQVKREYDESNVRNIYDEINEGLDYDRYRRDIPDAMGTIRGYGESGFKGLIVNPLPPGQIRRTARHLYKYKVIPNKNEAKKRVKTIKLKLYDEMRVGKHAQLANTSSHVSL
jgi:hypothetical protein